MKLLLVPCGILLYLSPRCQQLIFKPTEKVKTDTVITRKPGIVWGNSALRLVVEYQPGNLEYFGVIVPAQKVLNSSYQIWNVRLNRQMGGVINGFVIQPRFNNFAYCFGVNDYVTSDPQPILDKLYDMCQPAEAEIMILYSAESVDSDGIILLKAVHGGKLNPDRTVNFKPSIWGIEERKPVLEIQQDYNYNKIAYFKRKK